MTGGFAYRLPTGPVVRSDLKALPIRRVAALRMPEKVCVLWKENGQARGTSPYDINVSRTTPS